MVKAIEKALKELTAREDHHYSERKRLEDLIARESAAVSAAVEKMAEATENENTEAYKKAKAEKLDNEELAEMHRAKLKKISNNGLFSLTEYENICNTLLADIEAENTKFIAKLNAIAVDLEKAANAQQAIITDGNEVLARLKEACADPGAQRHTFDDPLQAIPLARAAAQSCRPGVPFIDPSEPLFRYALPHQSR